MLEFAIAMPMLVVFAAGVIDIGIGLRREQVVHAAVKEGARLGAASGLTGCQSATAPMTSCSDVVAIAEDAVDTTGKKRACKYIQDAGLDLTAWDTTAVIEPKKINDPDLLPQESFRSMAADPNGDRLALLRVTVQSSRPPCFLCILGASNVKAESVFVLNKACI